MGGPVVVCLVSQQRKPRTFTSTIEIEPTTITSEYQAINTAAFIFCGSINIPSVLKYTQESWSVKLTTQNP